MITAYCTNDEMKLELVRPSNDKVCYQFEYSKGKLVQTIRVEQLDWHGKQTETCVVERQGLGRFIEMVRDFMGEHSRDTVVFTHLALTDYAASLYLEDHPTNNGFHTEISFINPKTREVCDGTTSTPKKVFTVSCAVTDKCLADLRKLWDDFLTADPQGSWVATDEDCGCEATVPPEVLVRAQREVDAFRASNHFAQSTL